MSRTVACSKASATRQVIGEDRVALRLLLPHDLRPEYIVGVDPGSRSGGLAVLHANSGECAYAAPTPPHVYALKSFFEDLRDKFPPHQTRCFLEKVHSMPRQGVVSTFTFGKHYGLLEAFLVTYLGSAEPVIPQRWQKELKCQSGGDKKITRQKAQELFPQLKVTHRIADALLIAEYGRRSFNPE